MAVRDLILLDGKRGLEEHGGAVLGASRASDAVQGAVLAAGAGRMGR